MKIREKIKDWYVNYTKLKWTVGVADFDPDAILDPGKRLNIHWVKHKNKGSWFADPFILSVTEDFVFILVEEFVYSANKGRISRLKVNRHSWELEKIDPVIEQGTHLSFPAYYRKNGKVYIYPENSQSGKLSLFEYDEDSGVAAKVGVLSNCPLADAVIWQMDGKKVVMATTSPDDNGRVLDIYPYHEIQPREKEEPVERISFPERIARNAGMPFDIQGRLFRPAQDCARRYGESVIIQEVSRTDEGFQFKEVKRFYSPLTSHSVAFHTFNVFEDKYIAVDAEGMRNGLLADLFYKLREKVR